LLSSDVEVIVNGDRSTTNRLLREARCLIMPIRWPEPFGLVMIEAMASGTPVVALRRGAVPEVVRHGRTGWICDDPSQLPRALLHAAKLNPDDCVAHVRAEFSADRMVRRYEQVYRKAIANAQHGRRPVRWPIGVARARPAPSVVGRAASQQILLNCGPGRVSAGTQA
jgi:glycosyltransferase involved in cell wall biosynthesis